MTTLAPGTHVVVTAAGGLTGKTGVVVESDEGVRAYDVAVLLDEDRDRTCCELGFYVHELRVAS